MEIKIRPATTKDVPYITDLAVDSAPQSIPPTRPLEPSVVKHFRRLDLANLSNLIGLSHIGIFVAENDEGTILGHILGYTGDIESVTGDRQGWIFDLAVKEEFRGKGIAQKLVNHFNEFVKSAGLSFVGLLVTSSNKPAVNLYEKLGFVEERKRMSKKLD